MRRARRVARTPRRRAPDRRPAPPAGPRQAARSGERAGAVRRRGKHSPSTGAARSRTPTRRGTGRASRRASRARPGTRRARPPSHGGGGAPTVPPRERAARRAPRAHACRRLSLSSPGWDRSASRTGAAGPAAAPAELDALGVQAVAPAKCTARGGASAWMQGCSCCRPSPRRRLGRARGAARSEQVPRPPPARRRRACACRSEASRRRAR